MTYIKQWIEEAERQNGETVQAFVVGPPDYTIYRNPPTSDENIILTREDGLAKLGQGFVPMYAWTKSWIYFLMEYDGVLSPHRIPRNPVNCEPEFNGQIIHLKD